MENISETSTTQIKPAGAWVRYWAAVIDGFIITIPGLLLAFLIFALFGTSALFDQKYDPNVFRDTISPVAISIIYFIYTVYFTTKNGATWGKDAYGLRVVKYRSTDSISYGKGFLRELIKTGVLLIPIVGGLISLINGLVIIFSRDKRGIHDRIAGTQVIKANNSWPLRKQLVIIIPLIIIVLIILPFFLYTFITKNKF